jgi:hypothetical protein
MQWVGGVTVLAKGPKDAAENPFLKSKIKRLAAKIHGSIK